MDRNHVINALKAHESELRAGGVEPLYLFGSTARGEAKPESDVDLFLDYHDPHFSLIELVELQERISELLDTRVDLMTRGSLHPAFRSEVERAAVRIF